MSILKEPFVPYLKKRNEIEVEVDKLVEEIRKKFAEEKNKGEHKDEGSKAKNKEAFIEAESSKEPKTTSSSQSLLAEKPILAQHPGSVPFSDWFSPTPPNKQSLLIFQK